MLEVTIEEAACQLILTKLDVTGIKLNIKGTTGWPDRQFFVPGGRPVFIEFKQPGENPRPRQRLIHAFLEYNGYDCHTCDTAEEAYKIIKSALAAAIKAGWRPSKDKAARALAAARLSKAGREVHAEPGRSRLIP
jgi:hypothetical protein